MVDADFVEFSSMLDAVCSLLSRAQYIPNATNSAMWFRALARHDIATVRAGFDAHVADPQRGRFVPVPADILAQIEGMAANDGRPGPEEAWAIASRATDEADTVVWTEEIAQAWAIAKPVLANGDDVGARMSFKEAYQRLLDDARRARRSPAWFASLGFDPELQTKALRQAHDAGRLPEPEMLSLPAPEKSFATLLESSGIPPETKAKFAALRLQLTRRADEPSPDAMGKAHTGELKADAMRKVAAYQEARAVTAEATKEREAV